MFACKKITKRAKKNLKNERGCGIICKYLQDPWIKYEKRI